MSPLAGLRVVEIAQNLAGPFAGQILAMLGAEVIKLERPEGGDDARGWGPPPPSLRSIVARDRSALICAAMRTESC